MNKKIWILLSSAVLLAALLVTVLLVAVNQDQIVGICYREPASSTNADDRNALKSALEQQGFLVIVTDADADQAKQLEQLRQLGSQECDVLIVEPVMTSASEELLSCLTELEIPAILTGKQPERAATTPTITYFGAESVQAAQLQAQMILSLPESGDINGDGFLSYAIVAGPEEHISTAALTDAFCNSLSFDGLQPHLLTVTYTDRTRESAQQQCLQMLSTYGIDIEVIVCQSDALAQGAAAAVEESGWQVGSDYYLLGIGTQADTLALIGDGKLTGTVFFDRNAYIQSLVSAVCSHIAGDEVPLPVISYEAVTADNIDTFIK